MASVKNSGDRYDVGQYGDEQVEPNIIEDNRTNHRMYTSSRTRYDLTHCNILKASCEIGESSRDRYEEVKHNKTKTARKSNTPSNGRYKFKGLDDIIANAEERSLRLITDRYDGSQYALSKPKNTRSHNENPQAYSERNSSPMKDRYDTGTYTVSTPESRTSTRDRYENIDTSNYRSRSLGYRHDTHGFDDDNRNEKPLRNRYAFDKYE